MLGQVVGVLLNGGQLRGAGAMRILELLVPAAVVPPAGAALPRVFATRWGVWWSRRHSDSKRRCNHGGLDEPIQGAKVLYNWVAKLQGITV